MTDQERWENVRVYYHQNCFDGFCAAWVARQAYGGGAPQYVPASYSDDFENSLKWDVRDKDIVLLDFHVPNQTLVRLIDDARSVLMLDHHESAFNKLMDFDVIELSGMGDLVRMPVHWGETKMVTLTDDKDVYLHVDLARSGARLAWEWFRAHHPKVRKIREPWFISYVEDSDLWRFELDESRAVRAAMRALMPYDWHHWDTATEMHTLSRMISVGRDMLKQQESLINQFVKGAHPVTLKNPPEGVVRNGQACNASVLALASELGEALAEGEPWSCVYAKMPSGKWLLSFRSTAGKGDDCRAIAESLGGGGHRHASGSEVEELPWD